MQPVPVLEKHLVFKPNKLSSSTRPVQVGGAQDIQKTQQALLAQTQGDLFYMQLVRDVAQTVSKPPAEESMDIEMIGSGNSLPSEIEVSNGPDRLLVLDLISSSSMVAWPHPSPVQVPQMKR